MPPSEISVSLIKAKRRSGLSFAELSAQIGQAEVWVASLFYGQATAELQQAEKLLDVLQIVGMERAEMLEVLTTYPVKGALEHGIPTDPFLYRFYEILQVYGLPLKAVIQEKFGDGIMSAIDFSLTVDKEEDPKGDRVVITMNGKFLPYRKW
jgi:cyanate lyase